MLLNKIPCLDKGFVAYISSSNNGDKLTQLAIEFLQTTDYSALAPMANLTIAIKCPLFVQLNLSKFDLKIVTANTKEVEAYYPNVGEIGGRDREMNRIIADDIERTAEALLINPKAYQTDGCDRFISQVLMPVSTYTTLIVHGTYNEWKRFCAQSAPPAPLVSYTTAVKQILDMEWR